MSLRDAVETLRKLKVELDTSHRAKAELEVAYLRLVEELRVARQQASGLAQVNVEAPEDGKRTSTQGLVEEGTSSRTWDAERQEQKEREERLREELLQAKSALEESRTEQKKLEEDVKGLRDRVTETKLEAQVAEAHLRHELQEALAARDVAMEGEKCSLRNLGQVTSEAAKEAGRAAEAEEKLARALEDSAALNHRLEGLSKEPEDLKLSGREICDKPEDGDGDGRGSSSSVMEALETELRSIRETMDRSHGGEDKAKARQGANDAATLETSGGGDEGARKQVDELRSELERAVAENLELAEMVERTQKEASRSALVAESARGEVVSKEEALARKGEEMEALKSRLAAAEEERLEERTSSSRYAEDLEGARSEVAFLKGSLAEALREREELERTADANKARYQEEVASLRRESEELVELKDAELSAKREEVDRKQAEVAEKEAEISEKVARMATEREEAKAAATDAVAAAIVETAAAEQVNADRLWRTTVGSLKDDIRNAEEEREVLRQELAQEKQESENKVCEMEEEMRRILEIKESVEDAAKQSDERVKEAEEETKRYKSEVEEIERRRAATEEARCATEKERDAALEEAEKVRTMKQEVEDTLLIANEELQRLRLKCEEAESKGESSHAESERLARELKFLGAAAEEDASKARLAAAEASEEIASLKGRVQELEEIEVRHLGAAREAATLSKEVMGGDEDGGRLREGGGKVEDGDEIERERDNEAAHQALVEERDRLQDELRETRRSAAERTAALETQLGDAEREAADTQRRLYRQQSKLEAELEELRSSHDALRVELARMDAAMQDAADAADRSHTGLDGVTRRNGSANEDERSKKDPEELGAELGGAVGGILRGTFWTGRAGGASGSGAGNGNVASSGSARNIRDAAAVKGKLKQVEFQVEGESREAGGGSARGDAGVEIGKRTGRGNRAWTAESESDQGIYDRRQQSVSRVRHTMMTKLQEAANQPVMERSSGDGDGDGVTKQIVRGVESKGPVTCVPMGESPASSPEEDGEQGAFIGQSNSPERPRGKGGDEKRKSRPEDEDGWTEETLEHPPPDYGLDSPVIRHLLNQWSSDPQKLKYLTLWLRCVIEGREVPAEFPSGLQLVGLATEVKDGLLTLVVPMIRHTARVPVIVHSRLCSPGDEEREGKPEPADLDDDKRWDLRIKVDLKSVGVGSASGAGRRTEREDGAGSGQGGNRRRRPGGDAGATGVGGGVGTRERRGVMEQERLVRQQDRR